MKRSELTEDYFRDWWLKRYHNTDCAGVVKRYPRLCKTPKWFAKYPVTQEQHDEWHDWMIGEIQKYFKCSKKYARRSSWAIYLNCSPYVEGLIAHWKLKEDEK